MDWDNKKNFFQILRENEKILETAPISIRNDREIALMTAKINPKGLKYISKKLQDDEEVIMEGIRRYGPALEFASERLKANRDIVLRAVQSDGEALKYTILELKSDKEIIWNGILSNSICFRYIPKNMQLDKEFIIEILSKYRVHMEEYLKSNKKLSNKHLVDIIKNSGLLKNVVPHKIRNEELMLEVIKVHMEEYLKSNKKLSNKHLVDIIKNSGLLKNVVPHKIRNEELMLEVIKTYPYIYGEIGQPYKKSYIINRTAVEEDGFNYLFLPKEYRENKDFIIDVIFHNKGSIRGDILDYIPVNLKEEIINKVLGIIDRIVKEKKLLFSLNKNFKGLEEIQSLKNILELYSINYKELLDNCLVFNKKIN